MRLTWIFIDASIADHIKKTVLSVQSKYKLVYARHRNLSSWQYLQLRKEKKLM